MREAIYPLVPAFQLGGEEASFLTLFSALEGLSLFNQNEDYKPSTLLDDTRWESVKGSLKSAIDALGADVTDAERNMMKQKLGELNREPLRVSLTKFFNQWKIETDDLWPMFGSGEVPGLYEIRNLLAHGNRPADASIGALAVARTHLGLILERSVLSLLGFAVPRSQASQKCTVDNTVVGKENVLELQKALGY